MISSPLFVKLGGSILTDKTRPESIDHAALRDIAAVLAAQRARAPEQPLLIGHGGGSFGHYWADRYGTHRGVSDAEGWHGFARVADAMGRLNRLVVAALLDAGLNAVGVPPSAAALATAGSVDRWDVEPLDVMLRSGLVPVVCGDAVLDRAQGGMIASTEALFAYLAPRLQARRIVLVGEAGVYTADPRRDPDAVRIARINSANIAAVLIQTGASHGTDVTGGMASKVRQMWSLVQSVPHLEVQLVGTDPAALAAALRGEPVDQGTLISR